MPDRPPIPPPPTPGLSLSDIYYVLFRHKWKILIISGMGLIAACLLPIVWHRPYISEAKLLIRYVLDNRSLVASAPNDPKVKTPDERGENIINTELEILTSMDLIQNVVDKLYTTNMTKLGGDGSYEVAARVRKGLLPDVPKKSNVIRLIFQYPDPEMAQTVLAKLIETYKDRHVEIHEAGSVFKEKLDRDAGMADGELKAAEAKLLETKSNYNIVSLEDTKKAFTEQLGKVQLAILEAESELAERKASVIELTQLLHPGAPAPFPEDSTNGSATLSAAGPSASNAAAGLSQSAAAATNGVASAGTTNAPADTNGVVASSGTNAPGGTNGEAAAVGKNATGEIPPDKLAEYKRLGGLLETLNKQLEALNVAFTPESTRVQGMRAQVADAEAQRTQLETEYPGLIVVKAAETKAAEPGGGGPKVDLVAETARVKSLQAKIKTLNAQLERISKQSSLFNVAEGQIGNLQRKKDLKEGQFRNIEAMKERADLEKLEGADHVSNISVIQGASRPFQDSTKLRKAMAMVLFGSIAAALALAFLIEFYFDRSLRRSSEVEARYGLPLFVSIPMLNGNGKPRLLKGFGKRKLLAEKTGGDTATREKDLNPADSETGAGAVVEAAVVINADGDPGANGHAVAEAQANGPLHPAGLGPFFEALRDRLILYFEVRNLTHKPKLVALTSCREGSGVTTTAAGLAATLSETGDGNVLLVDMNPEGGAREFFRGRLACTLDEALEGGKRAEAQVQENLYLASEVAANGDKLPRVLPKRFKHLMPRLRASDYDYIIFDMPPISQISATPRLARFMDMVFVVVESEKTDRDVVKRATDLLAESKANLGIILNKSRSYVPKQLHQEL
jgi:uncharacterized protein involved in exopolysaccharide biosynthesis/Mrp family chromosome partitioning ATPase